MATNARSLLLVLLLGAAAACGGGARPPDEAAEAAPAPRPAPGTEAAAPPPERLLAPGPGTRIEEEIAGGAVRAYRLDLEADRFVALTVEQLGVDVVVLLRAPDGLPLRRVDSLYGAHGPEPAPFITAEPGAYRVEIHAPGGAGGRYALRVDALRPPTPADRELVGAEATYARGEDRRRQGGEGNLRAAAELHRRAVDLFRSCGARDRQADALYSLGVTRANLGEYRDAGRAYGEALELFRAAGRQRQIPLSLLGLGQSRRLLGEPEAALACYREALAVSRTVGDRWDEVTALGSMAKVYASLGQADEALERYEQALAGWRGLGSRTKAAAILNDLGQLYLQLGEVRLAVDRLEEALQLLSDGGLVTERRMALGSLGTAYAALGDFERGVRSLEEAIELHRQAGNRRDEAVALNDLGRLYRQAGDLEAARRRYGQALDLYRALGAHRDEATTLLNLGRLQLESGEAEAALRFYREALPRFTAEGDRNEEAVALLGMARARRDLGDLTGSRAAIEQALERIEALRTEAKAPQVRAAYFASKHGYYEFYVDLLMELDSREPGEGYGARAFEASERSRARSLLEILGKPGLALAGGSLAAEEEALSRHLQELERRRRELTARNAPAGEIEPVERELRRVLARHRRVRAALRGSTAGGATVSDDHPLTLSDIQHRVLDPESLLLEFFLGEKRSFLWAVTPTTLESFVLPGRATIEAAARQAATLLPESQHRTARARTEVALRDLARLVLEPEAGLLSERRLVIVPDGILHYVPFAALPLPGPSPAGPLIVRHEVTTLPSASIAATLRSREMAETAPEGTVAVVADPVFDAEDPRVGPPGRGSGSPTDARPPGGAAGGFPRLPYSRLEAEAILGFAAPGESLALLDFDANRQAVLGGALEHRRVVHFATHGIVDAAYPELSGLALSFVDRRGDPRNGFLRDYEIADLHLTAELVTLSACRTALGTEVRGEGLVGLTQAFFDAGARRVMVSLWPVEDRSTAELMRRFYRGFLAAGLTPAQALRQAQLSFWREGGRQAPFFWAGFVLQGDWR